MCILGAAPAARASDVFPGQLQEMLGLDCTPVCTTCHLTQAGGSGTMKEPFGTYVASLGYPRLVADFAGTMAAAATHDADGDTLFDLDEISANTDPGSIENGQICADARYGCGAQIAPGSRGAAPNAPDWAGLWAAAAVAGLLIVKRRRRIA